VILLTEQITLEATEEEVDNTDYIVEIDNLVKHYGEVEAVRGISLKIKRGSIFGFLGPNGAGKSTTINTLITLLHPTGGSGTIAGYDLYDTNNIKKKVGAVFQEQTVDETLTGRQNLELHAGLYNLPKDITQQRITDLVEKVGLTDRLDEPVLNYSGGMRRRLEIVRGLLTEPEILFLDEPTIGLDPQSRSNIRDKIRQMNRERNITIFLTTHDMEEAEDLCEEIYIIDQGKIVVKGTADELKSSLGHDFIIIEFNEAQIVEQVVELLANVDSILETKVNDGKLQITTTNGSKTIVKIFQILNQDSSSLDSQISAVEIKKPTLNDVFLYYTGKELRDETVDLSDRLKMVGRQGGRSRMGMRR